MSNKIIIMGNELELPYFAYAINQKYCMGAAEIVRYNNPGNTSSDYLFLVGHGNVNSIGDYTYSTLISVFGGYLVGAGAVCLCGCNTNNSTSQILKNGFVAKTLAQNVRQHLLNYKQTPIVYGTPGLLGLTENGDLFVKDAHPIHSGKIFVRAEEML